MKVATIKEIYNHCKVNNKPLLMNESILSLYPTIPNSNVNFISDYLSNFSKYDRVFCQKYMSKRAIFIDDKETFPSIYNEWIENCNDFVLYYLDNWARLYFALSDFSSENFWNPTHNYDGSSTLTKRTEGRVEGLAGKDITNNDYDKIKTVNTNGSNLSTTTDYNVPYDSQDEKETSKSTINNGEYVDMSETDGRLDSSEVNYGKRNEVDYTETTTEVKGGNLGVTSTVQLIDEMQTKLDSFWETVYTTLARELTIWEV